MLNLLQNKPHYLLCGLLLGALMLPACGPLPNPTEPPSATPDSAEVEQEPTETPVEPEPTEVPTEIPEETPEPTETPPYNYMEVSALSGEPQDTFEGTFELYLRDAINQIVRLQRERIELRAHYEDPTVLGQDLGGLVVDASILEDRTTFTTLNADSMLAEADFDLTVDYANGDSRVTRCTWNVNIERIEGTWYVVAPAEFPLFVNCIF